VSAFTGLAGRLRKQALALVDRYRATAAERTFLEANRRLEPRSARNAPIVLVETVEDHYYLALFARVVAGIAAKQPIRARQFVLRSLRPGSTRSFFQAAKSLCFYNALTDRKWSRLYAAFCGGIAYRSAIGSRRGASGRVLDPRKRCWI
jgi:hypothetical protein